MAALPPISHSSSSPLVSLSQKEMKAKLESTLTVEDERIVKLSSALDKSRELSDFELSFHFGICAPGDGVNAKGVFTNENRIDKDLKIIADYLKGEYLIFAKHQGTTSKIEEFVIIKKGPEHLQYYNPTTHSFKKLDDEALANFKLKEKDRCLQVGQGMEDPHSYIFPTPTKTSIFPPISNKMFYQERQTGLLCCFHAMNTFVGDRVCSLSDYCQRNLKIYQSKIDADLEALQGILSDDAFNPLESNDPGMLSELLISLSKDGVLTPEYQNIKMHHLANVKDKEKIKEIPQWKAISADLNNPEVDRVIVGWGAEHSLTLRRTSEGKWHVIDSQKDESQYKAYSTVEECLAKYQREGYPPQYFNFLFIPASTKK